MSDQKDNMEHRRMIVVSPLKTVPRNAPIIIRKQKIVIPKNVNRLGQNMYREDIVYKAQPLDPIVFKGNSPYSHCQVTITNQLNLVNNSSRTVARFHSNDKLELEKTSDFITKIIGQDNYDTIFSALCSVIYQELKIRGIMALLSTKTFKEQFSQTESDSDSKKTMEEKFIQTEEDCMDLLLKMKQPKRTKRSVLTPYVVKQDVKKVLVKVPDKGKIVKKNEPQKSSKSIETESETGRKSVESDLPELKPFLNEDSNEGSIDNLSVVSGYSHEHLLNNPSKILLDCIGQHTKKEETSQPAISHPVTSHPATSHPATSHPSTSQYNPTIVNMLDGTKIFLTTKPEDEFHYATPAILNNLTKEERKKMLWYQAYIDWKECDKKDEYGYLPIHRAVLDDDLDLLRRQCLVRKNRQESLDIKVENQTPLQLSIQMSPQTTAMLLQHGADPVLTDDEHRTCVHLAAEVSADHLSAVVHHCLNNARSIFEDHEDLYKPTYASKSDKELGQILLEYLCCLADSQGYTPLMLASKIGNYTNVKTLVEVCPKSVNLTMPNSGNTALFLAVGAACLESAARGNKSKISDKFYQTISALIENGADPSIDNHAGTNVTILLADAGNTELANLIAKQRLKLKIMSNLPTDSVDPLMIIKSESGELDYVSTKSVQGKAKKTASKSQSQGQSDSQSESQSLKNVRKVKSETQSLKNVRKVKSDQQAEVQSKLESVADIKIEPSKSNVQNFTTVLIKTENEPKSDVTEIKIEECSASGESCNKLVNNKPIILQNIKLPLHSFQRIDGTLPNNIIIKNPNIIKGPVNKASTSEGRKQFTLSKASVASVKNIKLKCEALKRNTSEDEPSAKKLKS